MDSQSAGEEFVPCNPETKIHLSEEEFKTFIKGGGFDVKDAWPLVVYELFADKIKL